MSPLGWLKQIKKTGPHYVASTGRNTHTHTRLLTVNYLLLAAPHHVDVLYTDEMQLDVGIVVLVLIAFTCCSICHGVQLDTHRGPYMRI